MSTHSRTLSAGSSLALLLGGCFNPSGQATEATGAPTASGTSSTGDATTTAMTATAAADPTLDPTGTAATATTATTPTTDAPTTGTTTAGTTGGVCEGGCPSDTPYCIDGVCTTCQEFPPGVDCAQLGEPPNCNPATGMCVGCAIPSDCDDGLCHPTLHECVECIGSADCLATKPDTPHCDPKVHVCRGCLEHAECGNRACELDLGECFPEEPAQTKILYAAPGAPNCAANTCTQDTSPCCSVKDALDKLAPDANVTHIVVHLAGGADAQPVFIGPDPKVAGKVIAIRGGDDASLVAKTGGGEPTVWLSNGDAGKLFLAGVAVTGDGSAGVSCTGSAVLWVDDVTISDVVSPNLQFPAKGLYGLDCAVTARRTRILGNQSGAMVEGSGSLTLINTIVAGSLLPQMTSAEVFAGPGATLRLIYSTIGTTKGAPGSLVSAAGAELVSIRNSALVVLPNLGGEVLLPAKPEEVSRSVVPSDAVASLGSENVVVLDPTVEIDFAGWPADLRVVDAGALADVALWLQGDPTTDLEGSDRPNKHGLPDIAGADRP